jgi:3-dehydroquinate dehydratase-2
MTLPMKIAIINGPNLNLLGKREPGIYGSTSFEDFFGELKKAYPEVELSYQQSNVEGELVNYLQEAGFDADGILLNAGAYTHTSVAIRDAITAVARPTVEVHLSQVYRREEFRHRSLIAPVCIGVITGFGPFSYDLALDGLIEHVRNARHR